MNYFAFVGALNGIVALLAGLYIFFKDTRNPLHASFFSFAITVALWSIFYAIWQAQTEEKPALFFMRMLMAPCYYIPFGFLWFVYTVLDRPLPPKLQFANWAIPTVFLFFSFSELTIKSVTPKLFFPFWPNPGLLMHLYVVIFFIVLFHVYYLLFKAWSQSSGIRRWQLRWVTLTTLFCWGGGSTNWFLWYDIPIPPIPNVLVGVFLLVLAYAVMRRHLFDVDALADYVQEAKLSALGILAAGFFHEIRNPLFVARGYVESLRLQIKGNVKQEERIDKILEQVDRISEISKRFSEFAKPSLAGRRSIENIRVGEAVGDILSFLGHEFQMDRIRVEKDVNPGTVIPFDRKHLEEILLNLFINACQAMPKGGLLRISGQKDDRRFVFKISDSGGGIPPDKTKRIFDPFFTTKEEGGMGLGLYIVKKLVERNGGKIGVASEVGRGTTFTLEFQIC